MGGDNNGHLIICLILPEEYSWTRDTIYYNININLYQYIYGLDIPKFNINNWIPYKNGNIINIKYINYNHNDYNYLFAVKLNTVYNDTPNNVNLLKQIK